MIRPSLFAVGSLLLWFAGPAAPGAAVLSPDTSEAVRASRLEPLPEAPQPANVPPARSRDEGASGAWTCIAPRTISRRAQHTMIFDAPGNRLVVFGGYDNNEAFPQVWTRDMSGASAWTRLDVPPGPDGRRGHVAVFDSKRRRMVVFGGQRFYDSFFENDTWALDLSGTPTWERLSTGFGAPRGRIWHSAIYDPVRDRVIVFGGFDGAYLNEVWALTLSGTPRWAMLPLADGPTPSGRAGHGAVYDPVGDRMIVIGGSNGLKLLDEVWALELSTERPRWTRITPFGDSGIAASWQRPMAYDPGSHLVIAAAGGDAYALTLGATSGWVRLPTVGVPPSGRSGQAGCLVPSRGQFVFFGGYDGAYHGDTWSLSLGAETLRWNQAEADPPSPPHGRYGHVAVFDTPRDRMIVFGGASYGGSPKLWGDIWSLSLGADPGWSQVQPCGTAPGARMLLAAALDPVRERMIAFGGWNGTFLNDLWSLSLAGEPCWLPIEAEGAPPVARDAMTLVYDSKRDRMLLFGGFSGENFLGDLWALDLSGTPKWTAISVSGPAPPARRAHAAVYDAERDRLVISGGEANGFLDDLWALPLGDTNARWLKLQDPSSPGPRRGQSAIFDPRHVRLVEFGGDRCGDCANSVPSDATWERVPAGGSRWRELTTSERPALRMFATAVYDADAARMVVFGGLIGTTSYSDAWGLDLGKGQMAPPIRPDASLPASADRDGSPPAPLELRARFPGSATAGALDVDVSSRDHSPARLELFTVAGRRIVRREIDMLGPEWQTVRMASARDLTPGVYVVRLTAAGHSLSAKAVVMR